MKKIEEFFKNKTFLIPFVDRFNLNITRYVSKNIFKPKDYSLDFLKEKNAPFCCYIHSDLIKNGIIEYSSTIYGFNHNYSINGGYYKFEIDYFLIIIILTMSLILLTEKKFRF